MNGLTKCPKWLIDAYRRAVCFICEECKKDEIEVGKLSPHRIFRGNAGGTYRPGNIKMLCKKCHKKKYHSGEFK